MVYLSTLHIVYVQGIHSQAKDELKSKIHEKFELKRTLLARTHPVKTPFETWAWVKVIQLYITIC